MSSERAERRLAAILAADVAGYSRLMAADEDARCGASRPTARRWRCWCASSAGAWWTSRATTSAESSDCKAICRTYLPRMRAHPQQAAARAQRALRFYVDSLRRCELAFTSAWQAQRLGPSGSGTEPFQQRIPSEP